MAQLRCRVLPVPFRGMTQRHWRLQQVPSLPQTLARRRLYLKASRSGSSFHPARMVLPPKPLAPRLRLEKGPRSDRPRTTAKHLRMRRRLKLTHRLRIQPQARKARERSGDASPRRPTNCQGLAQTHRPCQLLQQRRRPWTTKASVAPHRRCQRRGALILRTLPAAGRPTREPGQAGACNRTNSLTSRNCSSRRS